MAAARSRDKISLCARAGAPGAKGSPRFGLIFRESRYHILLPLPLPRHHSALSACPSFFALSLFGLLALDPPPSPSIVPRCGEGGREREDWPACLLTLRSGWISRATLIVAAAFCAGILIMSTSRNTLCKYHIYAVERWVLWRACRAETIPGRRKEIFNFLVPSSFQSWRSSMNFW